ncbi:MAG TPA: transglycosylase SLT domain-containing protein [Candidatus Acidoferrales bacterium]
MAAALLLFVCAAAPANANPQKPTARKTTAPRPAAKEQQIEKLARALKEKNHATAYAQLSAIALRKSSGVLGMRAALALGYDDYSNAKYPTALKWLTEAQGDPLLRDYSLYWIAETNIALNHNAVALAELQQLRADFPDSVMTEQALESIGTAAIALNQPAAALAALDSYPLTGDQPALLLLRGEAREQSGQPVQAASDYQAIYLRFPLSDQAHDAEEKLNFLRGTLGTQISPLSLDQQVAHAAAMFAAKKWDDAGNEYSQLLPQLTGAERERASLRILECGLARGASPEQISALTISDSDVDAERSYTLANWYRVQLQEPQMAAAVEAAVARNPTSHWAEAALFLAGNYYWVQLDRDRAVTYYQRLADQFPSSSYADAAQWRVAWTAVLKRDPQAADLLTQHLRRFPGSSFTPDALYWLGRLAEEAANLPDARAYYTKLAERFPNNYFTRAGAARMHAIEKGTASSLDILASIPTMPPMQPIATEIPQAAAGRQARADALRMIAFDASAELELRAGYAATGEPRLLLEAAQAAVNAGHCGAAIVMVRQIVPQLESHPLADVPREVWLAAYPLPFAASIRRWSAHAHVDPMLAAGLIHQESAFEPTAHSPADALGLMQLLPKTARLLARQQRIRYSHARLFDPDYNIRLGTAYVANLIRQFGSVESVLAAYNAGEDRVTQWTAGQTYREPAEFVDSIPFTETRDYVEIVTRNAEIYRQLYGAAHESRKIPARRR